MKGEKNYYKILGVNEKASNYELRKAFCKLTKELHPDTTALNLEDAKIRLQKVLEAYENLNNPSLRNLYDLQLKHSLVKDKEPKQIIVNSYSSDSDTKNLIGNRRPFSNGEMFALLLLALVIGLSLLFALIFANFTGREINSIPIWLIQ